VESLNQAITSQTIPPTSTTGFKSHYYYCYYCYCYCLCVVAVTSISCCPSLMTRITSHSLCVDCCPSLKIEGWVVCGISRLNYGIVNFVVDYDGNPTSFYPPSYLIITVPVASSTYHPTPRNHPQPSFSHHLVFTYSYPYHHYHC